MVHGSKNSWTPTVHCVRNQAIWWCKNPQILSNQLCTETFSLLLHSPPCNLSPNLFRSHQIVILRTFQTRRVKQDNLHYVSLIHIIVDAWMNLLFWTWWITNGEQLLKNRWIGFTLTVLEPVIWHEEELTVLKSLVKIFRHCFLRAFIPLSEVLSNSILSFLKCGVTSHLLNKFKSIVMLLSIYADGIGTPSSSNRVVSLSLSSLI